METGWRVKHHIAYCGTFRYVTTPIRQLMWQKEVLFWLLSTFDPGGEVEDLISGRLLHDAFERRGARLFRRFSSQPAHQLNEIDRGGNCHMAQMRFG